MAKFVSNILPDILKQMRKKFKWSTIPRVAVHDKASYMVPAKSQRLNVTFARGLKAAGLRSWVGDAQVIRQSGWSASSGMPIHTRR